MSIRTTGISKEQARTIYTAALVDKNPQARDQMRAIASTHSPKLYEADLRVLSWTAQIAFKEATGI